MKLDVINCPACNSPIDQKQFQPNQPFNCPACGSAIVLTDWTTNGQIICSRCGAINGSSNKFCDNCRAILQSGCPFCYTVNRIDTVYCKHCGANLRKAWTRQRMWLAQREENEEERKQNLEAAEQHEKEYLARLLLQLNEPENHPAAIPIIRIFGRDAVEPLIDLLHSEDPDARFGAARVLGDIGDRRAIPPLIDALRDSEEAVRFWALDALGIFRAEEAVDRIGELLKDHQQNKSIRDLAKDILIQIGSPGALQYLREESKPKWWFPFR